MPYNGSGVFSVYTPGTPYVTGTVISSTVANNVNSDFATGLSTAITKDGQTTITANIPMASFKFTGLAAGSTNGDSVRFEQLATTAQNGLPTYLTSVAGTNTITGTATPTPTYAIGQRFVFVPAVTNTGATTLNISSVGAGAVQWVGAALTGGELVAGAAVTVVVTAATPVFEIVRGTQFPDSRALVVGATDSTKKLRFEVDGITTATTRVATMPDRDITLNELTSLTNSIAGDVAINNAANYFDGPTVAQGTAGTWFASGTVTITDTASAAGILVKLWDGTSIIASGRSTLGAINGFMTVSVSGPITSPAGNIRISVRTGTTTGVISANGSTNGKDSTITVFRIA